MTWTTGNLEVFAEKCRGRFWVKKSTSCHWTATEKNTVHFCQHQLLSVNVDRVDHTPVFQRSGGGGEGRKRFEGLCEQHGVKEVAKVFQKLSFRGKGSLKYPRLQAKTGVCSVTDVVDGLLRN